VDTISIYLLCGFFFLGFCLWAFPFFSRSQNAILRRIGGGFGGILGVYILLPYFGGWMVLDHWEASLISFLVVSAASGGLGVDLMELLLARRELKLGLPAGHGLWAALFWLPCSAGLIVINELGEFHRFALGYPTALANSFMASLPCMTLLDKYVDCDWLRVSPGAQKRDRNKQV